MTRHLLVVSALLVLGAAAAPAVAAPTEVTLVLEGVHPEGDMLHRGTFAASAPLCQRGSWADLSVTLPDEAARTFTCADGSGQMTLVCTACGTEHNPSGIGTWHVVYGTGPT